MQAWQVTALGEPQDVLRLDEVADLSPGPGQVAVRVRATAANFPDVLLCRGHYQDRPALPFTPGIELCGDVLALGDGVEGLAVGDRVLGGAVIPHGGYAEQALMTASDTFLAPVSLDDAAAASLHVAYQTGWFGLHRRAALQPGETLLVHAAAGGVGSAAVVAARHLGAEVVATAGSEAKLELPLSLGASQAVTYDRLSEIAPVDVVLDPVGGQLFADSIGLLRPLGNAVAIGFAGGAWPSLDPALLVGRNVGAQGFYLGRLMQREPGLVREAALELLRLWREGDVWPLVGSTFPLADVAEAHRLIESRQSTAKVVLVT